MCLCCHVPRRMALRRIFTTAWAFLKLMSALEDAWGLRCHRGCWFNAASFLYNPRIIMLIKAQFSKRFYTVCSGLFLLLGDSWIIYRCWEWHMYTCVSFFFFFLNVPWHHQPHHHMFSCLLEGGRVGGKKAFFFVKQQRRTASDIWFYEWQLHFLFTRRAICQ